MRRNDTKVLIQFIGIVVACVLAYGIYFSLVKVVEDTKAGSNPTTLSGRIQAAVTTVKDDREFPMTNLTHKAGTYVVNTAQDAYVAAKRYSSYLANRPGGILGNVTDWFYGDTLKQNRCYQSQRLNKATRVYGNISSGDKLLQDAKTTHEVSTWSKVVIVLLALLVLFFLIRRNKKTPTEEQNVSSVIPQASASAPTEVSVNAPTQAPVIGNEKSEKKTKFFEEKSTDAQLTMLCEKYDLKKDEMIELYGDDKKAFATLRRHDLKCLNDTTRMDQYVNEDKAEKTVNDIIKLYDVHISVKGVYGTYTEAAENLQQYASECGDDKQKMYEIVNRDVSYLPKLRSLCKKYGVETDYVLGIYGDIEDTYGHMQSYAKRYGSDKAAVLSRIHLDAKGDNTETEAEETEETGEECTQL